MDAYTLKAFAGTVQMECDALDKKEKEIVRSKQGHSSTKLFCREKPTQMQVLFLQTQELYLLTMEQPEFNRLN